MKHILTLLASRLLTSLLFAAETTMWYDKPATRWEPEALPIGTGQMGADEESYFLLAQNK